MSVERGRRLTEHDLHQYMRGITDGLAAAYERIRRRTSEDPGTAGDQGEEDWGALFSANGSSSYDWITCGRAGSDRRDQQVER